MYTYIHICGYIFTYRGFRALGILGLRGLGFRGLGFTYVYIYIQGFGFRVSGYRGLGFRIYMYMPGYMYIGCQKKGGYVGFRLLFVRRCLV